ncbi:MAG: 23S rRNA (adenine(2503)-C(2))-methyltransferase RlmN [Oscillospiraceae bacterium]|nr:23S rRNA (adenine(2503)-C(2))-methyltransferase RlmN [Oscillospiraceae bacterium]
MTDKIDILSLDRKELEEAVVSELSEKKFRAGQIYDWLHVKKVADFSEMTNLSADLRTKLNDRFCIKRLNIFRKLESAIDNTVKYLYGLDDGNIVESVVMEYSFGLSICVSTQIGCKMGCDFCASTIAGFVRNLTPSEILLQKYEAERDLGRKISRIVLMGIGEPLDNYENVLRFIRLVTDEKGDNLSQRHITLSTCGIVPKIYKLSEENLSINLAVSLHSPSDEGRSRIMPVNRKYGLSELIPACREYVNRTGRRITFEYAVIENENSSLKEATQLASLLRGMICHVNLIGVNNVKEREYKSTAKHVEKFRNELECLGVNATIRRKLGADIDAACGQLRREFEETRGEMFEDSQ